MKRWFQFLGVLTAVLVWGADGWAGVPITLYASHAGNINYESTGATLRTESNNGDSCAVSTSASAVLPTIPGTATVQAAYLYWAGSFSTRAGSTQTTPDDTITFEGQSITADRMLLEDFQGTDEAYFCGFKEVTGIVSSAIGGGDFAFTVGDLTVNTSSPHCDYSTVISGWALVVVYKDTGEDFRVINIFDGFEIYYGSSIFLTPSNFQIPTSPINGKMTHISWEGDESNSGDRNGYSENLYFNSSVMSDTANPQNNQYNSTINALDSSTAHYGVDIDTYDISSLLSPSDTSATSEYSSGADMVLLTAEIISVTNTPVSDLAVSKTQVGDFTVGQNTDYVITVTNNGPDVQTDPLTVTDVLPNGLTYVSSWGDGWTVDTSGLPTITWTHPGPLAVDASLPAITLTVTVGAAAYPSASNTATVSSASFDNISGNDTSSQTGTAGSIGVSKASSGGGLVQAGEILRYDITLTNLDSSAHTNINAADGLPPGVSYVPQSTVVTVSSLSTATFRDEFSSVSYGNNDGTDNWATNWLEIGESDGANRGDERVTTDGAANALRVRDNDNGGEGVQREVNLGAYDTATLSFDYRRNSFDNANDYVTISISNNGGSSWTELDRFQGPATDAGYNAWSMDISSYLSGNTRIRFLTSPSLGRNDNLYIDNVEIAASITQTTTYTNVAGDPNPLSDGTPSGLVTTADGFSIPPGADLSISYQVAIDDPLDSGITQIETTSSISSDQTTSPVTGTVVDYVPHLSSWQSDYTTEDNLYYRDPAGIGVGNDAIYIGGPGWVPLTAYDVGYYDAQGNLAYTDSSGTADSSAFLTSSYDNATNTVSYGTWTAVAATDGTSFQPDLPSQLSNPATIGWDAFQVRSWSAILFTDASGTPVNGYDIPGGSNRAYVRIMDPDQNTDPSIAETITITIEVTNAASTPTSPTDSETIVLTETGIDTGIFEYSAGVAIAYGSGAVNDGILNVTGDEYLYVGYADPVDSADASEVFAYVPTLAILSSFRAYQEDHQVFVEWETASELGTLGFYLYRQDSQTGKFRKLNKQLLPGLLVHSEGGTYRFIDEDAVYGQTYTYKLIEKEIRGKSRIHGPYTVTVGGDKLNLLEAFFQRFFGAEDPGKGKDRQDALSGEIAFDHPNMARYHARPRKNDERTRHRLRIARFLKMKAGLKRKKQKGLKAKIVIQEKGIYRLDAAEIADVLQLKVRQVKRMIRKGRLSLRTAGQPVAWTAAAGKDGLYFYGAPLDTPYTRQNVYWLEKGRGIRMESWSDAGLTGPPSNDTFTRTVHFEEDRWPLTALFQDPEADFWIWDADYVSTPDQEPKTIPIQLEGVADLSGAAAATLRVNLKGGSDFPNIENDHHFEVGVNGTVIGEGFGKGTDSIELAFSCSQLLLQNGENRVSIRGLLDMGAPYSFYYIDSVDVTYQHTYTAASPVLAVPGHADETIRVNGFANPDILVFDITNSWLPQVAEAPSIQSDAAGYAVTFTSAAADATFLALTIEGVRKPFMFQADQPDALKARTNQAEYLVITCPELEEAARELAQYRNRQGLLTKVVLLEDIYDAFNHGITDPHAIRAFLSYARQNWLTPPRYVVLAGDGTYDYQNRQGQGDNRIPPLLISTAYGLFASDQPYADLEGQDGIPEVAIGRIPVITPEGFKKVVQKIRQYEDTPEGTWSESVLMMADKPDNGGDFPVDSDTVAGLLPVGYRIKRVYLSELGIQDARANMMDAIDAGTFWINYLGHGAVNLLSDDKLLTTTDIPGLQNTETFPVLSAMTCVAGRFSIPGMESLGEALLTAEAKGAVAVWAPTGYSMNADAVLLNQALFADIFQNGEPRLGDAIRKSIQQSQSKIRQKKFSQVYNLLGDPALQLKNRRPQ